MTTIPSATLATVDTAKVRDYLLNAGHPQNGGKCKFFELCGFTRSQFGVLQEALRSHPVVNAIVKTATSQHGTKYVVECNIQSPNGRNPCVTTVWIIDTNGANPRFVTVYAGPIQN